MFAKVRAYDAAPPIPSASITLLLAGACRPQSEHDHGPMPTSGIGCAAALTPLLVN
jgi:hypothetical protein